MPSRNINDSHPILYDAYQYARKVFNEKYVGKYCIKLSCVQRSYDEQLVLFSKGREQDNNGNWDIVDERKIVTKTLNSKHCVRPLSHAIDIFILNLETRKAEWTLKDKYTEFAIYMKEYNHTITSGSLDWGWDMYHFQI